MRESSRSLQNFPGPPNSAGSFGKSAPRDFHSRLPPFPFLARPTRREKQEGTKRVLGGSSLYLSWPPSRAQTARRTNASAARPILGIRRRHHHALSVCFALAQRNRFLRPAFWAKRETTLGLSVLPACACLTVASPQHTRPPLFQRVVLLAVTSLPIILLFEPTLFFFPLRFFIRYSCIFRLLFVPPLRKYCL